MMLIESHKDINTLSYLSNTIFPRFGKKILDNRQQDFMIIYPPPPYAIRLNTSLLHIIAKDNNPYNLHYKNAPPNLNKDLM